MRIRSTRCRIDVASYPLDQKTCMARSRTTSRSNSLGRPMPHRVPVPERSVKKTWYGPDWSISLEEGSMTLQEKLPDGLNPRIETREIVFDADVNLVTPFLKLATVSRGGSGHMLKVTVNGMRMRVTARYRVDGSVLNDTVQGRMLGAETTLEIDSPDPPERVAKVVRNAERGCFVMQALQNPVPVTGRTLLNGTLLAECQRRFRLTREGKSAVK